MSIAECKTTLEQRQRTVDQKKAVNKRDLKQETVDTDTDNRLERKTVDYEIAAVIPWTAKEPISREFLQNAADLNLKADMDEFLNLACV